MFGYVKAYKPELKVKDFDTYKGIYCGVCKTLGRNFGQLSRLGLSYDITFLCLIRLSFADSRCELKHRACLFNPFRKKPVAFGNTEAFDYATSVGALMSYYKLIDNIEDEGFFKSLGLTLIRPYFSHLRRKACKRYSDIDLICRDLHEKQKAIESENCGSIDKASHPTAVTLGKIFAEDFDGERAELLYRMGYCIGKAIYLMDAADDYFDDVKKRRYNPLIFDEAIGECSSVAQIEKYIEPLITNCISEAFLAFSELDCTYYIDIIQNIITLGMDASQKQIFYRLGDEKNND